MNVFQIESHRCDILYWIIIRLFHAAATSATTLGAGAPRESTPSTENTNPAPPPQAAGAGLPIVNLLTQILSGAGAQGGEIQTGKQN